MRCETIGASNGLRRGTLGLVSVLAMLAVNANPADARHRGRHGASHTHAPHAREKSYTPPYADFVVDANSGAVMHATSADSLRHPASLTKIMTLYLLFEQLEAGKIKLDSPAEVSAHAASQAPTKLGLRPGQTIAVEDAIKAHGDAIGQRCRGGRSRESDRRRRRDLRRDDDAQGAARSA